MQLIAKFFKKKSVSGVSQGVGDVYTFKTSPFTEFSAPETNRYGVFKVIGYMDDCTSVVALDVVTSAKPPTIPQVLDSRVLVEERFYFSQSRSPAVCNVYGGPSFKELQEVQFLFNAPLTPEENECLSKRDSYSWCGWINSAVEGEWRWKNDRDRLIAEAVLRDEKETKIRESEELRIQHRLKLLTWDKLKSEKHFSTWELPPKQFTKECRNIVRDAIEKFQHLSAKPKKKDVRRILVETLIAFNALDREYGQVIETVEREDIMMLIDEMAYVAKHRSLVAELDELRDW